MSYAYSDPALVINPDSSPDFSKLLELRLSRRQLLKSAAVAGLLGGLPRMADAVTGAPLGFKAVPVSTADTVVVPAGYTTQVLFAWGDPVGYPDAAPTFLGDASNNADDQALQAGMHHDGMHYFPLPYGTRNSQRGLLVINHEYTDDGLLHSDGYANWNAEKVRKSQNAHGCSVIEVREHGGRWQVVRPSRYARRITANTPVALAGPAAGHALLQTASDPAGRQALGTFANCAHGYTPWGTYLTCEENWQGYFVNAGELTSDQRRNGISAEGNGYRWHEFDERFDAALHPNEPNRFGWVVEFDPFDPQSPPLKRTALGRFNHEGATTTLTENGRLAVYMGDDKRFEHIYKFVSRDRVHKTERAANRHLLDHGTLYVAKFNEDGSGEWLPLVHGSGKLTADNGFADQGEVLIRTRAAADVLGATRMDRPEWIAVHPLTGEVYCTLTNNKDRGTPKTPGLNAANPRPENTFGHIIRWREARGNAGSTKFEWDIFVFAGDPAHADENKRGNIHGDAFGSPDGLWFDRRGVLWIETDASTSVLNQGDYANLGNNQMLAADIASGEIRRFLTGPNGCEITGIVTTPDGCSMFINIQHPGESASERSNPENPQAVSNWPDGTGGGRPRSATIVIRKGSGGVIGS